MAKTPARTQLVRYMTAPTGGADGVPYEGPVLMTGPADAVPEGARVLGPVEDADAGPAAASPAAPAADAAADGGA